MELSDYADLEWKEEITVEVPVIQVTKAEFKLSKYQQKVKVELDAAHKEMNDFIATLLDNEKKIVEKFETLHYKIESLVDKMFGGR